MFNMFGSKKKEEKKVPTVNLEETTNRLGNNITDVKIKIENTDKELKTALEVFRNARTPIQKQQAKQKATNILKKKKMYETHLNNLSNTQYNVENAHMQTQMMRDNMDIMNTLKVTVNVQKEMMKEMNPDDVYNMMDDMREIQEDQNEMNEAFNRNYEVDVADEELDADELDYQMRVELDAKELTVPSNQRQVLSKKEQDERELNDLLK